MLNSLRPHLKLQCPEPSWPMASLLIPLLAIGLATSGCSLLTDDGDPLAGADAVSTDDLSSEVLTATTVDSDSDSDSNSDSGGDSDNSAQNSETTSSVTTAPTSSTTESSVSGSSVDPVFTGDFCDAPQRNRFEITFDPGAVSSVIDSATIPGQVDLYEIEVGADQIMVITLGSADPDAVATLYQPDDTIQPGAFIDSTVTPTQAGSYWICITAGEDGSDYQLSVSVIDDQTPTKIDAPWCGDQVNDRGEIRFDPGRFSGDVENAVIRGERDLYRLSADAGQPLDLFLASPEFNAVFDLRAPSGEILIDEVSDFRIPLPESGTYEICIGGTRGNASYVLSVAIG